MELSQSSTPTASRIHPLVAGAAVAVTLVSLLGVAAISGILPNSHGGIESQKAASSAVPTVTAATSTTATAPVLVQTPAGYQYMQPVSAPVAAYQQVEPQHAAPTPTHHTTHHRAQTYAQADTRQPAYQQPAYQQPARQANHHAPDGDAERDGRVGRHM